MQPFGCPWLFCQTLLLLLKLWQQSSAEQPELKPVYIRNVPLLGDSKALFNSGYATNNTEVPFIVGLNFRGRLNNTHWFCAGSLLSRNWILSTASCIQRARWVKISYGAAVRNQPLKTLYIGSRALHSHERFVKKLCLNDIALIQTPYVNLPASVKPIALPSTKLGSRFSGEWTFAMGWGKHKVTHTCSNRLHIQQVEVVEDEQCRAAGYGNKMAPKSMLCGQQPNKASTCHLDSGSPLVLQTERLLIGIASFGNQEGCNSMTPVVYTRVSHYLNWIHAKATL